MPRSAPEMAAPGRPGPAATLAGLPPGLLERIVDDPGLDLQDQLRLEATSKQLRAALRPRPWRWIELSDKRGDSGVLEAFSAGVAGRGLESLVVTGPRPTGYYKDYVGWHLDLTRLDLPGLQALTIVWRPCTWLHQLRWGTFPALREVALEGASACTCGPMHMEHDVSEVLRGQPGLRRLTVVPHFVWSAAALVPGGHLAGLEELDCVYEHIEGASLRALTRLTALTVLNRGPERGLAQDDFIPPEPSDCSWLPENLVRLELENLAPDRLALRNLRHLQLKSMWHPGCMAAKQELPSVNSMLLHLSLEEGRPISLPASLERLSLVVTFVEEPAAAGRASIFGMLAACPDLVHLRLGLGVEQEAKDCPDSPVPELLCGIIAAAPLPRLAGLDLIWADDWAIPPQLCPALRTLGALRTLLILVSGTRKARERAGERWEAAGAPLRAAGVKVIVSTEERA